MLGLFPYLLAFSRLTLGFVFATSFIGKITAISVFQKTIADFEILPNWLGNLSAYFFLGGEILTVGLLLIGGKWLGFAFLLANLLLIIFTIALALVLSKKIKIPCNCFGPNTRLVSRYDLVRNGGLLICSLIGWTTCHQRQNLTLVEWTLSSAVAGIFVLMWLSLRDVLELIRAQ